MARKAIGAIEAKLTAAQLRLVRELVEKHQAMGDCTLHGFTLRFPDYEGANVFRSRVYGAATPTTRAYVSIAATVRKIDEAIVRAAQAKKAARGKAVA
jgi:hypothetical protein